METVTESLQSSVNFKSHLQGLERAQSLLLLYQRATLKAQRKKNDVMNFNIPFGSYKYKCAHQALIAGMASERILKAYKRQLFNLFYKSKL